MRICRIFINDTPLIQLAKEYFRVNEKIKIKHLTTEI